MSLVVIVSSLSYITIYFEAITVDKWLAVTLTYLIEWVTREE